MANPNVQRNLPALDQDFMRLTIKLNEDIDPTLLTPLVDSITAIRLMLKKLTPDELKGIFADTRPDLELKLESLIEATLPDNIRREIISRIALFLMNLKTQQATSIEPDLTVPGHQRIPSSHKNQSTTTEKPEATSSTVPTTTPESTTSQLFAKTKSAKAAEGLDCLERQEKLDSQYETAMRELQDILQISSDFSSLDQDAKERLKYGVFVLVGSSLNAALSKAEVETMMNSLEHRKAAAAALTAVFKVSPTGARGFFVRVDGSEVKGRTVLRKDDWLEKLGEIGRIFIDRKDKLETVPANAG